MGAVILLVILVMRYVAPKYYLIETKSEENQQNSSLVEHQDGRTDGYDDDKTVSDMDTYDNTDGEETAHDYWGGGGGGGGGGAGGLKPGEPGAKGGGVGGGAGGAGGPAAFWNI